MIAFVVRRLLAMILRDVVKVPGHMPEGLFQFIIGWPLGEPARPFRLLSVVRGLIHIRSTRAGASMHH